MHSTPEPICHCPKFNLWTLPNALLFDRQTIKYSAMWWFEITIRLVVSAMLFFDPNFKINPNVVGEQQTISEHNVKHRWTTAVQIILTFNTKQISNDISLEIEQWFCLKASNVGRHWCSSMHCSETCAFAFLLEPFSLFWSLFKR